MKNFNRNTSVFFALLRAGLWEQKVRLSEFGEIDYSEVYRLASEQSVVGLIAAGMEHVVDVKVPQNIALSIAGDVLKLEQRNIAMNRFIRSLLKKLGENNVHCLLVKGQGIAQCYHRPLWRACGDIDLVLDDSNYEKAKELLKRNATHIEPEKSNIKHVEMTLDGWSVELHGTLRSQLGKRIDKEIDVVQEDAFVNGRVRTWQNGDMAVSLPSTNNDIIFVFTHILQHFFNGGCGLRQICDWCRLLWTYYDDLNVDLLEKRLMTMRLMSEWRTLAALAVNTLGMPSDAMPLYSADARWKIKGERVLNYVMRVGNMGHSRDWSYREKYSAPVRKIVTLARITADCMRQLVIFPKDALRVWWLIMTKGVMRSLLKSIWLFCSYLFWPQWR